MRQSGELQSVSTISYKVGNSSETQIEESLGVEALAALHRVDVRFKSKKYELDMKNRESLPAKPIYRGGSKVRTKSSPTLSQV